MTIKKLPDSPEISPFIKMMGDEVFDLKEEGKLNRKKIQELVARWRSMSDNHDKAKKQKKAKKHEKDSTR